MMICFAIAFCLCFVLRFYLIWENKRRDRGVTAVEPEKNAGQINMADKTDKEMMTFRYVY